MNIHPFKIEVIFNYDICFTVAQSYPHGPKLVQLTVSYFETVSVPLIGLPADVCVCLSL